MQLCTVQTSEIGPFFGLLIRRKILRVAPAALACGLRPAQRAVLANMMTYMAGWPNSEKLLRKLLQAIADKPARVAGKAEDGAPFLVPLDAVAWLPPIPAPSKILCVGLNYRAHCEEQNKPIPTFPIIFNKFQTSLIGHEAPIPLPLHADEKMDYEAELAFVIGKRASRVRKRAAMKHVAGYMLLNDVSARSLQDRERQWARAKGFDGSGPCGPFLVTPDQIGNPHALDIKCRVNHKVMQHSNTRDFIFTIPEIIQHITEVITLEPGDIVSTGTPGGVGVYREPQVFLKPGNVVEVEIEKLGKLRNACGMA